MVSAPGASASHELPPRGEQRGGRYDGTVPYAPWGDAVQPPVAAVHRVHRAPHENGTRRHRSRGAGCTARHGCGVSGTTPTCHTPALRRLLWCTPSSSTAVQPRSTEGWWPLPCCYWLMWLVHRQQGVVIARNCVRVLAEHPVVLVQHARSRVEVVTAGCVSSSIPAG